MDAATRARISKRERQRRWRQRNQDDRSGRRGTAVVAHLTDVEVAVLDLLAIRDYERRPCGRSGPPDLNPPSRSRAIRMLIRQVLEAGLIRPEELTALIPLKEPLGQFWSAESNWRRASQERRSGICEDGQDWLQQPVPVWRDDGN